MLKTSVDLNEVNIIEYTNRKITIIWLNKQLKCMETINKSTTDGTFPIYLEWTIIHTYRVLILHNSHNVKIH